MNFEDIQRRSKELFREEAAELLTELQASLLELEKAPGDDGLINRVFRALHTLKGSGATSGFVELSAFLHRVEDVYNAAREGRIRVESGLIDRTLKIGDAVNRYLSLPEDRACSALEESAPDLDALLAFLPAKETEAKGKAETPVPGGRRFYRVRFRPKPAFFASGSDPGMYLDDLRKLGPTVVNGFTDRVPGFPDLDPEQCWLHWSVDLATAEPPNVVRDVFLFVEEDCELEIAELAPEDAPQALLEPQERIQNAPQSALPSVAAAAKPPAPKAQQKSDPAALSSLGARSDTLRVSAEKIDRLVNLVGELVILRSQVNAVCETIPEVPPALQGASEGLLRLTTELRDVVLNVRMMPIGETFAKFKRLVRDICRDLGKEAEIVIEGAETELDKSVLDQLGDPLVHLVRNALDHGLERPEEREAAGKPRQGSLRLAAEQRGDSVLVLVSDDGRGLDPERIRKKAIERGLLAPEATPSLQEIYQLIFLPGFSTAEAVSTLSGRGVGMDVVKRRIELLRGSVELRSEPGRGTEVRLSLPLTLAIIEGLMVEVDGDRYIIPLSMARETIEITRADRKRANGRNVVELRGELIPYLHLRSLFNLPGPAPEAERVVIVEVEEKRIGLVVDGVLGNHQTVLKSLGWLGRRVQVFTGATVLGDGRVALILDVQNLIAFSSKLHSAGQGMEV